MKTENITTASRTKTIIVCCAVTVAIALIVSFKSSFRSQKHLTVREGGKQFLSGLRSEFGKLASIDHHIY
jgi:hypothetical protein